MLIRRSEVGSGSFGQVTDGAGQGTELPISTECLNVETPLSVKTPNLLEGFENCLNLPICKMSGGSKVNISAECHQKWYLVSKKNYLLSATHACAAVKTVGEFA